MSPLGSPLGDQDSPTASATLRWKEYEKKCSLNKKGRKNIPF